MDGNTRVVSSRARADLTIVGLSICIAVLATAVVPVVAGGQMAGMSGMSDGDSVGSDAVSAAMGSGLEEMAHMRMTTLTSANPADAARAAAIVTTLREALKPYADYHRALEDGYRIFAPRIKQRVYHFSNNRSGFMSVFRFDPARPTSLLYEKTGDSSYRLVGAMYTAPRRSSLDELNARVPLSVGRWHLHTNWCIPRAGGALRYDARGPDGRPLFGGEGSITTASACTASDGWFFPQVLGWMVHVYPFATDPAEIWSTAEMH